MDSSMQEGYWISPEGKQYPVSEHLAEIRNNPERFGLSDIQSDDIGYLRSVAEDLIRKGWIRYRMFGLEHHLEVFDLLGSKRRLLAVLKNCDYPEYEDVIITDHKSGQSFQGKVQDFQEGRTLRKAADSEIKEHIKWACFYDKPTRNIFRLG